MPGLQETLVYERGDRIYLVAPVTPETPNQSRIEEFAFGRSIVDELRQKAPNEHLAWYGGHYVEADIPNGNGAMWASKELAIKSLTPMLMPVTVMHDPRTAVGLIADVALRTREADSVPRSKIETALAVWKHRFPEVVEEAEDNYRQGTLMQSMECLAPNYDCSVCGRGYTKLPDGAERANWCEHLNGTAHTAAARILRAVVFTGTGLIFGSRGATGADPNAHLDTFQEEVAEFHQRVHRDHKPRRKPKMENIEIPKAEYDELRGRPEQAKVDEAIARAEKAEKDVETAETAQKKAEQERDEAKQKLTGLEEKARQQDMREERMDTLGKGFVAALGDKTKERLREQAGRLEDAEWTARLEELEELTGKKRDLGADDNGDAHNRNGNGNGSEFTSEEIAAFQGGGPSGDVNAPTQGQRRSVLTGL